jgi:phosphoglycerate dehydrogenase-like enzyme
VQIFRIAITGDFLNPAGQCAYGDAGLAQLRSQPFMRVHFLQDQKPRENDPAYWESFYSMQVRPEHLAEIDGLIVLRPWVQRSTFARGAGDLVVIGRSGAGYDKIDLTACTENDVALFNAPSVLDHSTASTALLFMLALAKRLPEQERITRLGRWDQQDQIMGSEIQGRTLGIVGLGRSGRELVRLVAPFAMRILAYSPHADPDVAASLGVRLTSLDEVLREADFVSIHCRLTEETRNLIGVRELAMLKPTAYLINVARGPIIDQAALMETLRSKRIAGAGLDVFTVEPLPTGDPLIELDNVILTPHWSASTTDVWQATGKAMAEGMLRAAQGEVPENVVNPKVLSRPGFQAKLARFTKNRPST